MLCSTPLIMALLIRKPQNPSNNLKDKPEERQAQIQHAA